jgi:hypothetical protein
MKRLEIEKNTMASIFDSKFESSGVDKLDNESINFVDNSSLMDRAKFHRKYEKQSTQMTNYTTTIRPSIDAGGHPATVTGIKEIFKRSALSSAMTTL